MYRIFKSEKDTYITDRVIKGNRTHNSNLGRAGTLDLFKLYGATRSGTLPNNELSRILIKFNIDDLRTTFAAGQFDITSSNFKCLLKLYDVYGGQTTPDNFSISLHPLSRSFEEGTGRDVVFYQDYDVCNFLTSSGASIWFSSGANAKGNLGSSVIDILESGSIGNGLTQLWKTQNFVYGTEDLELDVTTIISATLKNLIPDEGFRISFVEGQESDLQSRFVKRFCSRHSHDSQRHPQLVVMNDDSVQDNQNNFVFDYPGNLFFYNKIRGNLKNIVSSSNSITGTNCLYVTLKTQISGATYYETTLTASQYTIAGNPVSGTYFTRFTLDSNNSQLRGKVNQSGSVVFSQIWRSLDNTVGYFTGTLSVAAQDTTPKSVNPTKYYVVATNVDSNYEVDDVPRIRVHIEDVNNPYSSVVKTFIEKPSVIPENVYFSIRDSISQKVIIPFDATYNSTKLSSDATNLYFDLYMSSLHQGLLYEIDIMIVEGGIERVYKNVCAPFKLDEITW